MKHQFPYKGEMKRIDLEVERKGEYMVAVRIDTAGVDLLDFSKRIDVDFEGELLVFYQGKLLEKFIFNDSRDGSMGSFAGSIEDGKVFFFNADLPGRYSFVANIRSVNSFGYSIYISRKYYRK